MTKDQPPTKVRGIWCRKNKTFYYLETGHLRVNHPVDRLKKVLMRRGLLAYDYNNHGLHVEPYKVMTWEDAQERDYTVEVVYLNPHIRNIVENATDEKSISPWRK